MEIARRFSDDKYQDMYEKILKKITPIHPEEEASPYTELVDTVTEIAVFASVATLLESKKLD